MGYLSAFLMLSFLIFIHELGHFSTAKLFKMPVKSFAIGFGPAVFKFKKGDTDYRFNILPLGGYVQIEGENDASLTNGFLNQVWYKRLIVLMAGIVFNFITAIILFVLVFNIWGSPSKIVQIQSALEGSYASEYIQSNDQLISIDGHQVNESTYNNIGTWIKESKDKIVTVQVKRDGEKISYDVPLINYQGNEVLGITFGVTNAFVKEGNWLHNLFVAPLIETYDLFTKILASLGMLVTGEISVKEVQGPVGIVNITNEIANHSLPLFLYWMGMLSLNLGIMNALPIPALDGGQVFFLFVETIVGKKRWTQTIKKSVAMLNVIFLLLLLSFMLYVTVQDVTKLF